MHGWQYALCRCLIEVGVSADEVEECMAWALGEGYESEKMSDTPERWNARHADLFKLCGEDNRQDGMKAIGRAYLKQKGAYDGRE